MRNKPSRTIKSLRLHKPGPKPERSGADHLLSSEEIDILESELALISCEDLGNWTGARAVLDGMAARGIPRRRQAWMAALNAHAKVGRWEEAIAMLSEMEDAGVRLNQAAFHSALEACEGQKVPDEGLKLSEEMNKRGIPWNVMTYVKVITLLAEAGRKQDAHDLYQEARANGHLTPWSRVSTELQLEEYGLKVAEVMIRSACIERATQKWAGKGGFYVFVGEGDGNRKKLKMVQRVMQDEFGLKIRPYPQKLGRFHVRGEELYRLAEERIIEGKQQRLSNYQARRIETAWNPAAVQL